MGEFGWHGAPGHMLRRVFQRHNSIFAAETAGAALTSPQFAVIAAVEDGQPTDQITLSRLIAIDRTTLGGIIDRLEQRGLVRRRLDPDDGRRRLIEATASGRALVNRLTPRVDEVQTKLLAPLTENERNQFMKLLRKLAFADDVTGGSGGPA